MRERIKFKKCKCPAEYWEEIVEDNEKVYHHCSDCGTDWAITDFETGRILYQEGKAGE